MEEINATTSQFLRDVQDGLSDDALQLKYKLSGKKFYLYKAVAKDYLAKKQSETNPLRRKISAKQVLADIRSGMDDESLMTRYNLSHRQLQSLFRKIIGAGLATPLELSARLSVTKSQVAEAFVEVGNAMKELD
ncbi:MAG: hypothetical protein HY914_11950 [Desulfomonile tiedjei]|nr:hypothetical protein [Desulfomonile tiedjei]